MKHHPCLHLPLLLAGLILAAGSTLPAAESPSEIDHAQLKVDPEAYNNDRVTYEAPYQGLLPNLPRHIADSGFDADRFHVLVIGSPHVPVMAERGEGLNSTLARIRSGDIVRVTGKIREFRRANGGRHQSPFYLDLEEIILVRKGADDHDRSERPRRSSITPGNIPGGRTD